jgi:hypothetical protein
VIRDVRHADMRVADTNIRMEQIYGRQQDIIQYSHHVLMGFALRSVIGWRAVVALHYKPEGRGFDSRW